jgi:signal transduction histidine kinase
MSQKKRYANIFNHNERPINKDSILLVRQKVIIATIITCIFITLLATIAYILAADRVGREQLAPEISRSYSDIFQLQLLQNPNNILALQTLANSMVQHYQIKEIALYNQQRERIIYACTNTCTSNLPIHFDSSIEVSTSQFTYSLSTKNSDQYLNLTIQTDIKLPQFFYADTLSTTLFIVSISTLLLFFLYNLIRYWQRAPYKNLLATIKNIQSQPDDKIRFDKNDADTVQLASALNNLIAINEEREQVFRKEKEKAESARIRAIRLSNETRQTNEKLAQEITIRRSVETQLTHTRSFLDSIIDSMPSALFTLDHRGYIIQCNQQAADWLACERQPLVGKRLAQYIDMFEHIELNFDNNLIPKVKKFERIKLSLPIGDFPADITLYPLKDKNLNGLVIRIDDISQREKMEEVIMQTEKMKSVGGLAAGMAHEINNPLGAILQGVQNIQRRVLPEHEANQKSAEKYNLDLVAMNNYLEERRVLKFINNIQDAGKRAASIVSNMLQFSRGNQKSLSHTSVKELLERTLNIARADLELKSIDIHLTEIDSKIMLHCIPSELEQVILNLLQNAAQALLEYKESVNTQDWKPQIHITTKQNNGYTIIKVKDNGPGMDNTTRRRIFEPFFTTKDVGLGTGLGLSVSYFIITAHHQGQLDVISSPNQGACFIIKLPNQAISINSLN